MRDVVQGVRCGMPNGGSFALASAAAWRPWPARNRPGTTAASRTPAAQVMIRFMAVTDACPWLWIRRSGRGDPRYRMGGILRHGCGHRNPSEAMRAKDRQREQNRTRLDPD